MKYTLTLLSVLLFSCGTYKPLYDDPTTIVDIAIHGIHCPCENVKFDEFRMRVKTEEKEYGPYLIKGDNIPKDYRMWIDTSLICETGCRIYIDNIVMKDSNELIKIGRKYYIDVVGSEYE